MKSQLSEGMVLFLTSTGMIKEVLHFPSRWGERPQPGSLWIRLLDQGSIRKGLNFYTELQATGAVYGWELDFSFSTGIKTLHLSGSSYGTLFILVATDTLNGSRQLLDEMLSLHNEQTNEIRQLVKEREKEKSESHLLEEVSRLNNELVTAQRDLAKKVAELEALNKEKNQLLGIVAHDLRNPLYAIVNVCNFLLEENQTLAQEGKEVIRMIQSSCAFMAELVDNLLDVSKIEAGQLWLQWTELDLSEIVNRTVEMNRLTAEKKRISLLFEKPTKPCILRGDGPKLQQVFHNLIANAIKFTRPGGDIYVNVREKESHVFVDVRDTGIGIPLEEQSKLFTPAHRGRAGTLGERSTGFGLLIVKRIVEGHDGTLTFSSKEGEGTTFTVSLPKRNLQAPDTSMA
ncbi:MAG: HAMP domain-containing histidine kinase [Spirochaetes bacterium]|nr:HAMP domain-containing histidine kinase [Spirochaetota bacterium]